HPNIRAFISHGGFLSILETVYYGVPVIGIPVFGDQLNNIAKAVKNGYAIYIDLEDLSEEKLSWALNEILNNPKYRENVQYRSKLMHDQPLKPIDLAIFWVEHVIRHGGAKHLRSAGLDLKWYQREMIDIILFLISSTIMTLIIFYIVIKKIVLNILVVFPMPAYSHFALGFRIAKELADKGHQVTVISPYPQETPIKNYRDISVADNIGFIEDLKKQLFGMDKVGPLDSMLFVIRMGTDLTDQTLKHKNVQNLLNSGETFDVVIMEHFLNDALVGIAQHFNAPLVLIAPSAASGINNYLFANPAPSSYVPNIMGNFDKHMNFLQRVQNYIFNIFGDLMRELVLIPNQRDIFKKYFKTDVEMDDILYNVSLMLTNSHVSVNDAVPHVPNMIEIGGFHVYPPKKLPDDLQKFLDNAKEGVILFSMGSNLKSRDLTPQVRAAILRAFAKMKQKVLWKFEADLPEAPKNVKIMKWLPQQDILAHPNIRAFISHGGLLSTIETVYHGVPVIGIPVFGDQKSNIARAVSNGYAVSIPLSEITEERLSWALEEILNNPKYQENVKQRSRVMKDQPMKPIDAAVYWIEHVIRHKGAPHLRTAGLDLKWYEREMVDIIIFLTLVTIIFFVIFYIIIKRILGLCTKKKAPVTKSKKNNATCFVKSANILFVAPMPAHSHFTLVFRLAKELADNDHQVTVINPYPQKKPIKNYRDISVEEIVDYVEEIKKHLMQMDKLGASGNMKVIFEMGLEVTEGTFNNSNVQKLLNSGETFDVVILEHFLNDALVGLGYHFQAPVIILSPVGSSGLNNHIFANPAPSSYIPSLAGTFTKHMNFWQRLQNFCFNHIMELMREFFYMPQQREIFKKYVKTDLELDDVLYNASLMFTNSHVSVNDAVPHVPNIIEIGGYHISPPKKLPEDLQNFLDNAQEGVVLFSMGSNLKSKDLTPETRKAILQSFSKIKQKVLWKFETDLPEAPKNVKIMKWLPQQDILAHPNVRAFISHGGLLSTIETVFHGVPVIGIPVYGDQKNNIAVAANNGYAINIPITEITEEKLSWALDEILNNPKYRQNVQKRSKLMHDRPLKPIDSAVYWIEHVIRYKGAPHLRPAGVDLKWYQREMVDVILFIFLGVTTICVIIYVTVKKLIALVGRKTTKTPIKNVKEIFIEGVTEFVEEFEDLLYNVSLILTNSHVSVNDAMPHVPNIIEIGGYHVSPPKKLPPDLQNFLDKAYEGVILFSMGSNLKSKDLTPEVRKSILKAFSKIKQKVLWKFETELPEASDNVKIMSWLPQQDILAHPNIRAFITHGGLLSTIETVYHGVPIIGIPVFGDQKNNIASAVSNGYAISVPLVELTEEKFSWTLHEILNNP
ncbi:UDP-glucuronosyltransferase 2C1-like, partial [Asbolus verrucosus]